MIEIQKKGELMPQILVIGIGGAGNNAIKRMLPSQTPNVKFASINTDLQILEESQADEVLQIGKRLTGGFGAGADAAIGEAAALESEAELEHLIDGAQMVILTCGMGGGTGTGAIPVIAKLCKKAEILTVAIVTLPFSFESEPRMTAAKQGVEKLKEHVDTLLVIPNDKLLTITDKVFYLEDAFETADQVLRYTVEGITNIIYNKGLINLDFHDLKTTLVDKGTGHLGIGIVNADGSLMDALKQAISSPLLETTICGASNILLNSSGKINILELNEAISYVRELAGEQVNIIWGTVSDRERYEDKLVITLIATGMKKSNRIPLPKNTEIRPTPTPGIKEMDIVIPEFMDKYRNHKVAKKSL